jgi:hypothetical protein
MKTIQYVFLMSTFLSILILSLCTNDNGPTGSQGNGLQSKYEGKDQAGVINYCIEFTDPRGDSGTAVITVSSVPVSCNYAKHGTTITLYEKTTAAVLYTGQLNGNELSLQNAAGQSVATLMSTSTLPQDTGTVHTGKGVLYNKYEGVMSGSDTRITFIDSSKTHGDVTFRLSSGDLSLTYAISNDSITFYAATVPSYSGILSGTQIKIYTFGGRVLLGTLDKITAEPGPLSGTYWEQGTTIGNKFLFFRESGIDSVYFYPEGASFTEGSRYQLAGDTVIIRGEYSTERFYLSDTKNSFWRAYDESIYIKDSTVGPGKINGLEAVIPTSQYKYKAYEGSAEIDIVTYGIGFGIDAGNNTYYFAYKWSSFAGSNINEESGSYTYNKLINEITFKVDTKGCTNGSGSTASCLCNGETATMSSDMKSLSINGHTFNLE